MTEKEKRKRKKIDNRRYELQSRATRAEVAACNTLDRVGIRYIKQYHVFTGRKHFYADIYIPAIRLIVEIDGCYHFTDNQRRLDANRSACLRRLGYHVYRITNRNATNPTKLIDKINVLRASKGIALITLPRTLKKPSSAVRTSKKRVCLLKQHTRLSNN